MTFSVPQTRATLSSLYDNFKVWTTAITDATPAYVMDGYRVNYDATAGGDSPSDTLLLGTHDTELPLPCSHADGEGGGDGWGIAHLEAQSLHLAL